MIQKQLLERFPRIVLASASPRRRQLMQALDIPFIVDVRHSEEFVPEGTEPSKVAAYLARQKAAAFVPIPADTLVITADTVVIHQGEVLGKPADVIEAARMLRRLSGQQHEVITAVCLATAEGSRVIQDSTQVYFREMEDNEIAYYIAQYKPYDKAGSYGAQDWLGMAFIERIEGSYFNVMGLPTHKLYAALKSML
ncbi:MAG: Maf-like protein [Thermonema sp.]|jgi:septum formation protein|uniref:Maf family nucleotide pyrophosphatase n=1 Tax=Thermonema sp. TaxID=2231181 RepID=UPI0021DC3FEB|nr:Maf family nucleotide pyrophosphatase [Thermonema sp.]GIV39102.1 MAG: Maf-like protein [Thermonema sp.]